MMKIRFGEHVPTCLAAAAPLSLCAALIYLPNFNINSLFLFLPPLHSAPIKMKNYVYSKNEPP